MLIVQTVYVYVKTFVFSTVYLNYLVTSLKLIYTLCILFHYYKVFLEISTKSTLGKWRVSIMYGLIFRFKYTNTELLLPVIGCACIQVNM